MLAEMLHRILPGLLYHTRASNRKTLFLCFLCLLLKSVSSGRVLQSLRSLIFHLPALPGSSTQSSACAWDTSSLHAYVKNRMKKISVKMYGGLSFLTQYFQCWLRNATWFFLGKKKELLCLDKLMLCPLISYWGLCYSKSDPTYQLLQH